MLERVVIHMELRQNLWELASSPSPGVVACVHSKSLKDGRRFGRFFANFHGLENTRWIEQPDATSSLSIFDSVYSYTKYRQHIIIYYDG